jgi:hypothetical protein
VLFQEHHLDRMITSIILIDTSLSDLGSEKGVQYKYTTLMFVDGEQDKSPSNACGK